MFRFLQTHSLATGMGLVALMALTGCQNFTSSSKLDLEGAITVPSGYVYTASISEKSSTREQNILTNLLMILESDAKSAEDKAELFYEVGSLYDDLGLEAMARFMLMNSIVNKPGFARPYELLGIYFFKEGRIAEACDAFDSAIELDKKKTSTYPYLNRAFVMYYTRHYKMAVDDMKVFFNSDPTDPYRMLSMYFVEEKVIGQKNALKNLEQNYIKGQTAKRKDSWGDALVLYYLDKMSQKELFKDMLLVKDDEDLFQEHLCEAYYYVGKKALEKGNDKLAYDYFKLCRSTRKYGFLEYRNAYIEMQALERKYNLLKVAPLEDNDNE